MIDGCLLMRTSETSARAGTLAISRTSAVAQSQARRRAFLGEAQAWMAFNPNMLFSSWFLVSLLAPDTIARECFGVGGIRPRQRTTAGDLLGDELLHDFLLGGIAGNFLGEVLGHDDHALAIADDHVTGKHGDAAAADRHVQVDSVMNRQIEGRAAPGTEYWKIHRCDRLAVAQSAIGDNAGGAAHLEPREQNTAAGCCAGIAAAIHDQDLTRRHGLDRLALRVLRIFENADHVEVLPRRDVAQGESFADENGSRPAHALHALYEHVAQAALEQLRGQRRGAG